MNIWFLIIPLMVLGFTAAWFISVWIAFVFRTYELREIFGVLVVVANELSLLSLGWWLASQNSTGMNVAGFLIMAFVGLVFIFS